MCIFWGCWFIFWIFIPPPHPRWKIPEDMGMVKELFDGFVGEAYLLYYIISIGTWTYILHTFNDFCGVRVCDPWGSLPSSTHLLSYTSIGLEVWQVGNHTAKHRKGYDWAQLISLLIRAQKEGSLNTVLTLWDRFIFILSWQHNSDGMRNKGGQMFGAHLFP